MCLCAYMLWYEESLVTGVTHAYKVPGMETVVKRFADLLFSYYLSHGQCNWWAGPCSIQMCYTESLTAGVRFHQIRLTCI